MTSEEYLAKRLAGSYGKWIEEAGLQAGAELIGHLIRWAYEDGRRDEKSERLDAQIAEMSERLASLDAKKGTQMDTEILFGAQA